MHVRDGLERDAPALGDLADAPTDVMRNLVHDRTVRVAEDEPTETQPPLQNSGSKDTSETEPAENLPAMDGLENESSSDVDAQNDDATDDRSHGPVDASIRGFVSFDAGRDAVHVSQLYGERSAVERLIEEPIAFARRETMPVEVLVPSRNDSVSEILTDRGFDDRGSGPRFDGEETIRFRLEVPSRR